MAGERDYRINFLANVRDFLRGMRDSGDSLRDLESDFRDLDRTSDTAHSSMQAAARRTAAALDDASREGGTKFKASGKEIGAEFMSNLGEGVGSGQPQVQDIVYGTIGGLANVPSLAAGAAAAGLGLGVALIGGFISRVNAAKAEARKAIADLADALLSATTDAEMRAARLDAALTQIGGGDKQKGYDRILAISDELNVSAGDLVSILLNGVTPQTKVTADHLAAAATKGTAVKDSMGATYTLANDTTNAVKTFYDYLGKTHSTLDGANGKLGQMRDITAAIEGHMAGAYTYAQQLALLNAKDPVGRSGADRTSRTP